MHPSCTLCDNVMLQDVLPLKTNTHSDNTKLSFFWLMAHSDNVPHRLAVGGAALVGGVLAVQAASFGRV